MKARIRFDKYPFFNHPPDKLVCAGTLLHRSNRHMWTLIFTVSKQISALVYEGDIRWETAPIEQDFAKGVKFHLFAGQRGNLDGKDRIDRELEKNKEDKRSLKDAKNDKKAGKDVAKARAAKDREKEPKEPKEPKDPIDTGKKNEKKEPVEIERPEKMSRLPKDAYVRTPAYGKLAEGELLG